MKKPSEIIEEDEETADIDPYLKEQNEGIFFAFSRERHSVLTTPEIEQHVDLSRRQVHRRLETLEDEGIVGSRKPGRTRLWWLEIKIEEPVSVQYPIIQLIRERLSLQYVVLGVLLGVVSVIFSTTTMIAFTYDLSLWILGPNRFFQATLVSSLFAVMFLLLGGSIAGTVWLFKHLGIEIRYDRDDEEE